MDRNGALERAASCLDSAEKVAKTDYNAALVFVQAAETWLRIAAEYRELPLKSGD